MKETKIDVKGMHCHSCEMIIEDTLGDIEGVKMVKASEKENIVIVKYDESKVSIEAIKKGITDEGYDVK